MFNALASAHRHFTVAKARRTGRGLVGWFAGCATKTCRRRRRLVIGDGTAGARFRSTFCDPTENSLRRDRLPRQIQLEKTRRPPLRDRVVLAAAETVYVLTLRSGGNLHRLLRERLEHRRGTVILVDLPGLQSEPSRNELCDLGAQTWRPVSEQCRPFENGSSTINSTDDAAIANHDDVYLIVPFPDPKEWALLTHTTRSCPGPWPDESFDAYADSLLESRLDADHSPLSALRRIIRQRRLVASGRTIRGVETA